MTLNSRAGNGILIVLAVAAAYGAGYHERAAQYPDNWRWPDHAEPRTELQRTADGNVLVTPVADTKIEPDYSPDLRPYETLDEVRRAIKENFVRTQIDDTQLTYGAIRGMLRSLGDRFTRFLTPEDYNEFLVSNKGEFTGIGARIDVRDDYAGSPAAKPWGASRPYIVEPIDGGPAFKAGLHRNDVILAIDGRSTADMGEDATVAYIRGTRGTTVHLSIERKTNNATTLRDSRFSDFDVAITRDVIEMHPVDMEWLPDRIAWLRLSEFNEKTDKEVGDALQQTLTGPDGQGPAKGLIFDLRENPGGLLTAAVDVGSRFIPDGPIVYTRERTGEEKPLLAEADHYMNLKMPIVVLIDKYSASAAEIVTGALKDRGVAKVVGEESFGKASVQVLVDLKNGGALVITTAKYLTPNKNDISDKGIFPDVNVPNSPEDERTGRGAQLQAGVDVIEGKSGVAAGTPTAAAGVEQTG